MIELFGYLSMIVVIISVTMKTERNLRIVNSISCAMFVVYGVLIESYPIAIMNLIIIFVNLYRLIKIA